MELILKTDVTEVESTQVPWVIARNTAVTLGSDGVVVAITADAEKLFGIATFNDGTNTNVDLVDEDAIYEATVAGVTASDVTTALKKVYVYNNDGVLTAVSTNATLFGYILSTTSTSGKYKIKVFRTSYV